MWLLRWLVQVVGLPTDTVYGMVADATKPRAVERLYNITGPHLTHQPITVVLDTLDQLGIYADLSTLERSMLGQLLPGRVTVVLRRKPGALSHLNTQSDLLPIRIPGHKEKIFIRKVTSVIIITFITIFIYKISNHKIVYTNLAKMQMQYRNCKDTVQCTRCSRETCFHYSMIEQIFRKVDFIYL